MKLFKLFELGKYFIDLIFEESCQGAIRFLPHHSDHNVIEFVLNIVKTRVTQNVKRVLQKYETLQCK
jgi:hypothetical protein